jgi:DNA-directed RNA polymerase subunit RPC12/RpoP
MATKLIRVKMVAFQLVQLRQMSGRCFKCNTRYIWDKRLGGYKEIKCPDCGATLHRTTHLFKGDTYRLESPYRDENPALAEMERRSRCQGCDRWGVDGAGQFECYVRDGKYPPGCPNESTKTLSSLH